MTPRENLLSLLRRNGYERVPVEFDMCPKLIEEYERRYGATGKNYMEFFQMPWQYLPPLNTDQTDTERFMKYHSNINSRTEVDEWGIHCNF